VLHHLYTHCVNVDNNGLSRIDEEMLISLEDGSIGTRNRFISIMFSFYDEKICPRLKIKTSKEWRNKKIPCHILKNGNNQPLDNGDREWKHPCKHGKTF